MNRRPASVTVAGLLCLGSAAYGLLMGTAGLEFFECAAPRWLVITAALVHLYCGFGLWAGDNVARGVTLWLLGAAFFSAWVVMYGGIHSHTGTFSDYAGGAIKVLLVCFFLWHLSGAAAVAFTGGGGGHGHGVPGHDDHGQGHGHAHP